MTVMTHVVLVNNNNNNKNITSMALKSSGARARKRNKTKSLIKFKSRRHIGVIISMRAADYLRWKRNFEEISFEILLFRRSRRNVRNKRSGSRRERSRGRRQNKSWWSKERGRTSSRNVSSLSSTLAATFKLYLQLAVLCGEISHLS